MLAASVSVVYSLWWCCRAVSVDFLAPMSLSVDLLAPVSLSSSCTNCLGRAEIFRLLDLIFALKGLKWGVLLPSRRAMLQRNVLWRPPKPMGDCDLPNEGNTSLHGAPTHGTVCVCVCISHWGPLIVGLCRNRICFENLYSSCLFQVVKGFLDRFLYPLFLLGYQS